MNEVTTADWLSWSTSMIVEYWFVGVGLLFAIGLLVVLARMGKIRSECRQALANRYHSTEILRHDNMAHYLGDDSITGKQNRGQGVLVLAADELYYIRLHPKMEMSIPLKRIQRIVNPTTFLGINSPSPLLQVHFLQEDGTGASVAWKLRDTESFTQAVKQQRKKIQPRKKSR